MHVIMRVTPSTLHVLTVLGDCAQGQANVSVLGVFTVGQDELWRVAYQFL